MTNLIQNDTFTYAGINALVTVGYYAYHQSKATLSSLQSLHTVVTAIALSALFNLYYAQSPYPVEQTSKLCTHVVTQIFFTLFPATIAIVGYLSGIPFNIHLFALYTIGQIQQQLAIAIIARPRLVSTIKKIYKEIKKALKDNDLPLADQLIKTAEKKCYEGLPFLMQIPILGLIKTVNSAKKDLMMTYLKLKEYKKGLALLKNITDLQLQASLALKMQNHILQDRQNQRDTGITIASIEILQSLEEVFNPL